jgi:hypothetical protein
MVAFPGVSLADRRVGTLDLYLGHDGFACCKSRYLAM